MYVVPVANTFRTTFFLWSLGMLDHLCFIVPKLVKGALYKFLRLNLVSPPTFIVFPNKSVSVLGEVVSVSGGGFIFGC